MILEYRKLEPNENIVIGADPSEGGDYSAFVAIITKKYSDVVLVGRSKQESSQLSYTIERVGQFIYKDKQDYSQPLLLRGIQEQQPFMFSRQLNYQSFTECQHLSLKTTTKKRVISSVGVPTQPQDLRC